MRYPANGRGLVGIGVNMSDLSKFIRHCVVLCGVISLLLVAGCQVVGTRVMDIPGSPCKRVVIKIEEEIGDGKIRRREEAVIICPGDAEWETLVGGNPPGSSGPGSSSNSRSSSMSNDAMALAIEGLINGAMAARRALARG